MRQIKIYTDGSCDATCRMGGWGAVLMFPNHYKEISGSEQNTTSQRMEITAVIEAIKEVQRTSHITVFSDSKYVVDAHNEGWLEKWVEEDFKLEDGLDRKNHDLWKVLYSLEEMHNVRFVKVKGHSDNQWNNKCDWLAGMARRRLMKDLGYNITCETLK